MSGDTPERPLMQIVSQIIDAFSTDGKNYDTLINVLSLICLITILGRGNAQPTQSTASATGNPLHKILGELSKGDGNSSGPSPDMLMSLLPLLNSPQLKSKLNPSNIATIMGLVNSLGGNSGDKQETAKPEKASPKVDARQNDPPAAAITASTSTPNEKSSLDSEDEDKKGLGRYLNWKTNF
jgi:hypothetical protein